MEFHKTDRSLYRKIKTLLNYFLSHQDNLKYKISMSIWNYFVPWLRIQADSTESKTISVPLLLPLHSISVNKHFTLFKFDQKAIMKSNQRSRSLRKELLRLIRQDFLLQLACFSCLVLFSYCLPCSSYQYSEPSMQISSFLSLLALLRLRHSALLAWPMKVQNFL